MKIYTLWSTSAGDQNIFVEGTDRPAKSNGEPHEYAEILAFRVEVATWEEAQAIKHLRLGYEPYSPQGDATPCPSCKAFYYPEGSGKCWKCGFEITR